MIKALIIAAEWIALTIKLSMTKDRAKRFQIISRFEKKLSK